VRQYSELEGEQIVRAARAAIELFLRSPKLDRTMLMKSLGTMGNPHGVYVTIMHYPTRTLRGRMGIHGSERHMGELVVDAAIAAAFEDPKYVHVSLNECNHMVVEVDIISEFEQIKSSGKGKLIKVKLGRDGLYIKYGFKSAVLLPSFAEENKLNKVQLFEAACKAVGIQKDLWMQPNVKISRFQTQRFAEMEPDGKVREVGQQK